MTQERRRRLLLIHDLLEERGGAETHFLSEARALRAQGYEVHTFGFVEQELEQPDALGYVEPRTRLMRKVLKFTFHPGAYRALHRYVQQISPDLVHLHMNTKYPLTVLAALRRVRVVQTVHSNGMFCPSGWLVHADDLAVCEGGAGWKCVRHRCVAPARLPLHWLLERCWHWMARRIVAAFVPPSRHLASYLTRFGFAPVHRIPYFSPVDSRGAASPPSRSKQILYVGVVTRQKGVRTLVEAMPRVLQLHPDAELRVIGDGAELEPLQALARKLGIEGRVQFLGRIPNQELGRHYQEATVCVVPSVWLENSPLVAYEAMLAGRPLVGSNRGGIPDLIEEGRCGFVVEANDPAAIAERVGQLLAEPRLAEELGSNGRRYALEALSKQRFFAELKTVMRATGADLP